MSFMKFVYSFLSIGLVMSCASIQESEKRNDFIDQEVKYLDSIGEKYGIIANRLIESSRFLSYEKFELSRKSAEYDYIFYYVSYNNGIALFSYGNFNGDITVFYKDREESVVFNCELDPIEISEDVFGELNEHSSGEGLSGLIIYNAEVTRRIVFRSASKFSSYGKTRELFSCIADFV